MEMDIHLRRSFHRLEHSHAIGAVVLVETEIDSAESSAQGSL